MGDYFNDNKEMLSYSALRALSVSPSFYQNFLNKPQDPDKEHFILGNLVDCLLTEIDKYDSKFIVEFSEPFEGKVPIGQLKEYIECSVALSCDDCYKDVGFKRDGFEAVLNKAVEYEDYKQWLLRKELFNKQNKDKTILSLETYSKGIAIAQSLKTNEYTKQYFSPSLLIYNQLEIYWELKGEKIKSKLDKVVIDEEKKTIQLIDIKTTGKSTFSFKSSALEWRYDIQAALYQSALYWLINRSGGQSWEQYKDFTMLPMIFIVESTKYQGFPLIYQCSDLFMNKGLDGFYKDGRRYKGILELIDEFQWCRKNSSWTYPREIVEKNGVISLDYE